MWLPAKIIREVDEVARLYYIDSKLTKAWNDHRKPDELRMLTGWCWTARHSGEHAQGMKTLTVAYRDAYYRLIARTNAPAITRPPLRVVVNRKAA